MAGKNLVRNHAIEYILRGRGGLTETRAAAIVAAAIAEAEDPEGDPLGDDASEGLGLVTVTLEQLTADTHDYDLGDAELFLARLSSDAERTITGILAPDAGTRLGILANVDLEDLVLAHEDAGSAAANRILCPAGDPLTIGAGVAVWVVYDEESTRWRVVGGTGGGAGGPVAAEDVSFDNTGTDITATDAQAAIAEIAAEAETARQRVVAVNVLINGGTATLVTGIRLPSVITIPWACTVIGWRMVADRDGALQVDVLRTTYADYDAPSTHPVAGDSIIGSGTDMTISATGDKAEDSSLDWDDVSLDAGDELALSIVSATTIRSVKITLYLEPA